ncbi:MAG TPA: hypothetical protein VK604_00210 [Bryobacteraceae bacterium]|nr:hypothetical protein [Bryobacteraceae bacterium]
MKISDSRRFSDLAMFVMTLVDDMRTLPPNPSSENSEQIERPLGMSLSTLVAANRGIPKRNGETADFGHHMKRREKVKKDGEQARFPHEPGRMAIARHLYLFRKEPIEDRKKLFITIRDIGVGESLVQLVVER